MPKNKKLAWEIIKKRERKRIEGIWVHSFFKALKSQIENGKIKLNRKSFKDPEVLNRELAPLLSELQENFPKKIDEIKRALAFICGNDQLPLFDILTEGYGEWAYVQKKGDSETQGRVDLWAVVEDKLWILDYKTGSSESKAMAFEQLERYRQVLCEYLKWNQPVCLVALYPFSQEVFIQTEGC